MIDCNHRHSLCTKCFANKVEEKGCGNKLKCYCGKRENVFTLKKIQLIDGALASHYYDYTIEKEEMKLYSVRTSSDIHSRPGFPPLL